MTYMISATCVTCFYLRNVGEAAKLTVTITRFARLGANLSSYRGYELPRLNERLVYLLFFSNFSSLTFFLCQQATHRTLLRYKPVTVRDADYVRANLLIRLI